MAKKTTEKASERFPVLIPRIPHQRNQEDIILKINGKAIQIQRGKTVALTKPFYEALMRHLKAEERADDIVIGLSSTPDD